MNHCAAAGPLPPQELRDLFRLDPGEALVSATQRQLHAMHAAQRRETPALTAHLAFLATLEGFAGVSDHDLLFSQANASEAGPGAGAPAPKFGGGGGGGRARGGGGARGGDGQQVGRMVNQGE